MRILVYEHLSAITPGEAGRGKREERPASLRHEGAAMLGALLRDLAALPEARIVAYLAPCAPVRLPRGVEAAYASSDDSGLRAAIRGADAVWLIAPETGGLLAALAERVEAEGRALLGPGSAAIRRAGDKAALAAILDQAGIPAPRTHAHPPEATMHDAYAAAEAIGFPLVVKPVYGAGCEGVGLVLDPVALAAAVAAARRAAAGGRIVLQRRVEGVAASVALVADGADAVTLALSAQDVRLGPTVAYRGGETPLDHPLAGRAAEVARSACEAVGGLRGYVGVDLVLTPDEAMVIEVNPRLTTAYLGVRAALDANPAALALDACRGRLPLHRPTVLRQVRFGASGRVRPLASLA